MRYSFSRMLVGLVLVFAGFDIVTIANANTMHISENGTGQVLLFPYYTARSGNVSLMSLVNTTTQGKAVRVTVREARGGFVVAQFNLYMSAKDVWTGAIVSDSDGAQFVSSDTSCTSPAFAVNPNFAPPPNGPTSLPFSADTYRLDNAAFISRDRTREGYIEVIEMATIPNATRTGIAVTHIAGVPTCVRRNASDIKDITDIAFEPPASDLTAPTGGLMGSMSFVNVAKGMLASAPPTVIENFWLTGQDAPALRVAPANSATIDLTSGKNTSVAFAATSWTESATTNTVERYTARFATSIDAVSALLSTYAIYSEYAYTTDQIIGTLITATMPTKPYYIRGNVSAAIAASPFSSPWDPATVQSCDDAGGTSFDREERTAPEVDYFAGQRPIIRTCSVVNQMTPVGTYGSIQTDDMTYFASPRVMGLGAIQSGGAVVQKPGKEGGWAGIYWTSALARISPVGAAVYRRNAAGALTWEPVKATLIGLPVIGFTLSQAAYQTGSPQQNFADAIPLRSQTVVYTVP